VDFLLQLLQAAVNTVYQTYSDSFPDVFAYMIFMNLMQFFYCRPTLSILCLGLALASFSAAENCRQDKQPVSYSVLASI